MFHFVKNYFRKKINGRYNPIDPDEIFLDSKNLPEFDTHQFEGRIEKPISVNVFRMVALFMVCIVVIFVGKLWHLQVVDGATLKAKSENNRLHTTVIFADRGAIVDRNGKELAWNTINTATTSDFSLRVYATSTGLSTVIGYVKYPSKDASGVYYQTKIDPKDGLEKIYDTVLSGKNGMKIVETDVKGKVMSESVVQPPQNGKNLVLSIDARVQKKLYESMLDLARRAGFKGGAAVIMDVHTGEIIANANFPEYDSQTMTSGDSTSKINGWLQDKNNPFLNRTINGLYTPGSIIKPFVAMGVLEQGVIDPKKQILSTGSISIPNPYDKTKTSTFNDWKAHGYVDLRRALAVSSNVYFYEVGGGYQDQKGIGITNIEKYVRMFGFGTTTGVIFPGEKKGIIPDPEWKKQTFDGEAWRVGDTYNSVIGQYGFQVTPIQVIRAVGALANEGTLLTPLYIKGEKPKISGTISLDKKYYTIVKEGMRLGVTDGTSVSINVPYVEVASKTGTAQIGVNKDQVNSWVIGFWPYKNPHYAYVVVMEKASKVNQFGAVGVMRGVFDWMSIYAPEYLK
jgi:penicillin-binding protein 2